MQKRRFVVGVPQHIYQKSIDGSLIFYSARDSLVYFSVFCSKARKYGIKVLGLCLMPDHVHQLIVPGSKEMQGRFEKEVTCAFSREFNLDLIMMKKRLSHKYPNMFSPSSAGSASVPARTSSEGTGIETAGPSSASSADHQGTQADARSTPEVAGRGGVFEVPFGSAPKVGEKKIRTAIAYLYNNPVERGSVRKAEDYRWSFLPYYGKAYPYSEKIVLKKSSDHLRRCVKEVRRFCGQCLHLGYEQLDRMFAGLATKERAQLMDCIISAYNVIEYQALASFYKDFETMLLAISSNTGSEYDIKEEWVSASDTAYREMSEYVVRQRYVRRPKEVRAMPMSTRRQLLNILERCTSADRLQAEKFLGLANMSE